MAYIEINNLTYYYPLEDFPVLENINVKLNKGDTLLIMGKSGSGKSTLGKAIVGSVPHFYGGSIKGQIKINGKELEKMDHAERAETVTMVFQDPETQLMMNKVHREVAFGLENVGIEEKTIKRRVFESMQFTNILNLADRDITTLSGGEKQKVAITSAVAYLPECIVLDEPISQLDPMAAEEIISLARKINEELGITLIIIEQRVNKWFQIANKIAYMENGSLSFYESQQEFYENCKAEEIYFLPDYLRIFKNIEGSYYPHNFKEARNEIEKMSIGEVKSTECKLSEGNTVISINKLRSYYKEVEAVKGISLDIKQGEFISIMGANGAGKSTFLKTLVGLQGYKGSIKILGREVKSRSIKELSKSIGYVSQNPNDYISRDTVFDELKFTMDNYGSFDKNTAEDVLKELDIYDIKDKNPRDLSGGQKQRVAIASILVNKPQILILDEPTRGIDTRLKDKLGVLLKKFQQEGTTIILVSHDIEFSSNYCDRFILMFNGEIVSDGSAQEVLSNGIYYTTMINKLFRHKVSSIYTMKQAISALDGKGECYEKI